MSAWPPAPLPRSTAADAGAPSPRVVDPAAPPAFVDGAAAAPAVLGSAAVAPAAVGAVAPPVVIGTAAPNGGVTTAQTVDAMTARDADASAAADVDAAMSWRASPADAVAAAPGRRVAGAGSRAIEGWWRSLAARERRLLAVGGTLAALLLVWLLGLQPAWRTLQRAPLERDRAAASLQQMQQLAAEAQSLRDVPPVALAQAQAALQSATDRLGGRGRLSLQGDRAVLTLTGVEPRQLREWLAEARTGARARPVEVTLAAAPGGGLGGSVVLQFGASP